MIGVSAILAIVTAAGSNQGLSPCDYHVGPPEIYVTAVFDTSCVSCVFTEAHAFATAFTTYYPCGGDASSCTSGCNVQSAASSTGCCSGALVTARGNCFDPPSGCLSCEVFSSACFPIMYTHIIPNVPCCFSSFYPEGDRAVGQTSGLAIASAELNVVKACSVEISLAGNPFLCGKIVGADAPGRHVTTVLASSSCDVVCGAVQITRNGVSGEEYICGTADPLELQLCEGTESFRMMTVTFTDSRFDLSGDGRFSQVDVDLLQQIVPTSDPELVIRFDLDGSGEVDQIDADILQQLINCGLGSGLFGDANRDGVVDCCDLDLIFGALGKTIGEQGYIIELDFDLDGIIDATDEAEMHGFICVADWNNDYQRNFFDSSGFIAAFNNADPRADLNDDGSWNFLDVVLFQGAFAKTCP